MKILAFETSCDDTAVAIVEDGMNVLSSVRVSQVEHNDWGGVVPEIAARLHAENWRGALEKCLEEAQLDITQIDALACTQGPGLQTSLLTGTTAASFLSQLYDKPLIPVHHIYGHLVSIFLERNSETIKFPVLGLTVSGGHTEIYLMPDSTKVEKIGQTRDDAAGEAFDKVAKMLGLGYPGGPIVSQRAVNGNPKKYLLPIPNLGKDSLEFSFSGVKAAVRRLVDQQETLTDEFVDDVCASFQDTVKRIFLKKLKTALTQYPDVQTVSFVGGVSANTYLKNAFKEFLKPYGINVLDPQKIEYSTDNAAMIASGAYFMVQQKDLDFFKPQFIEAVPRMNL